MKKIFLLHIIVLLLSVNSHLFAGTTLSYQLPKVLLLTTGDGDGRGTVSDGVVIALQAFNKLGAFVRLENREVLLKPDILAQYTILILPTSLSYHDADIKFSLTYLSEVEMKYINTWVENGGTLIAGDNIGRNTLDGTDRVSINGELNEENWELGKCFGIKLQERNMSGFAIEENNLNIWNGQIAPSFSEGNWVLATTETSSNLSKVLANWKNMKEESPAIILNKYGRGNAILVTPFQILHPANDGGYSSVKEIENFYKYVYELSVEKRKYPIFLNPWKNGHKAAFCLTFDDGGDKIQYDRIFNFLKENNLNANFFVSSNNDQEIINALSKNNYIDLQGHSHSHANFRQLSYPETMREILLSEQFWDRNFTGFRFPFASNSYWGMYILNSLGYTFDSSIAANHLEFYRGTIFPYNIPIFNENFYQTLDILELSQIFHDDWHFYQKILDDDNYTEKEQKKDALLFEKYLTNFWDYAVKPNNGLMVFMGHPMYSAISEITMIPLQKITEKVIQDDAWISTPDEVANYWNKLKDLKISVKENQKRITVLFSLPNETIINDISLKFSLKPKNIKVISKNGKIKKHKMKVNKYYYLIFNAENNDSISIGY